MCIAIESSAVKDYLPFLQTLLGGGVAIAGGFMATVFTERYKQKRAARNLAIAFKGEINAIKHIVQTRQYVEGIDKMIAYLKGGGSPIYYTVLVRREYFAIYKNNVSQIGILKGHLPSLIATFYTQANAILEDLDGLREKIFSPNDLPKVYVDLKSLFTDSMSVGDQIIAEIDSLYGE